MRQRGEKAPVQAASTSEGEERSLNSGHVSSSPPAPTFSTTSSSGAVAAAPGPPEEPTAPTKRLACTDPPPRINRMPTAEQLAEILPSEPPTPSNGGLVNVPAELPTTSSCGFTHVAPVTDTSLSSQNVANRPDVSSSRGEASRGLFSKAHPTALSERLLQGDCLGRMAGDGLPSSCSLYSSPPPTPMPVGDGVLDGPQQQQLASQDQSPPLFREEYSHMAPAACESFLRPGVSSLRSLICLTCSRPL